MPLEPPLARRGVTWRSTGSGAAPLLPRDGVTIAKEIELEDPFENMGAHLLKEAATKTNDVAGDGTTTATVLAQAIVNEGLKNLAAGANPIQMKQGIEAGRDAIVAALKNLAMPVSGKNTIAQVASISAADTQIGNLIAEVMGKIGKDGVITVEESRGLEFETEYVKGMQLDRGYLSPYFVTNSERMEAEIEDPYILITDKKISSAQDIVPTLEKLVQIGKREIVVIAEDVDGEALATLVLNKLRGMVNVLAIKAPGSGDHRKSSLRDIAILTGGQLVTEEVGRKLDSVMIEDLGRCDKIVSTKNNTTIIGGTGELSTIQGRINEIRVEIENTAKDDDREKLQERLAKLAGGVAIIRVGAATETELKEKKHRAEDALNATRAAVEEGIVPGGGVALINVLPALNNVKLEGDLGTGVYILLRALEEPMRRIATNAGLDGAVVIERVRALHSEGKKTIGYDVLSNRYVDMLDAGIIDPVKVTRSAIENACSIASMILTTSALVTDTIEREKATAGSNAGMGGMMEDTAVGSLIKEIHKEPPINYRDTHPTSSGGDSSFNKPSNEGTYIENESERYDEVEEFEAFAVANVSEPTDGYAVQIGERLKLRTGVLRVLPDGYTGTSALVTMNSRQFSIYVFAEDMEIHPQWAINVTISNNESELKEFTLIPLLSGDKEIRVDFYHQGHWLTHIKLKTTVVDTDTISLPISL